MKRILSLIFFATWFTGTAIAGEINYFNKSWEEIKAKAKAEHKYIFIDCYTDWCGWCKVMDKETMTDPGIISFINDKCIAVKMDMEHGEGSKMAMKYHVSAYPTFMFFNSDGEYVYESMGYEKTPDFVKELNKAMDKKTQFSSPGFSASIDIDFPEFYKKAYAENGKRAFPKPEEVTAFLDQQKDLFSEVSWGVMSRFGLNDKYTKHFLDNMAKYKSLYGTASVDDKLNSVLYNNLEKAIKTKNEDELAASLKMVDKYVTDDPALRKIYFRITFYKETKDWSKCAQSTNDFISLKGYENTEEINSISWSMYEMCPDKKPMEQAAKWMKEVVRKEPKYAYMDTYAAVLYKCGRVKEAKEWAGKAIAAGKKSGNDTKSTEELLNKINAAK